MQDPERERSSSGVSEGWEPAGGGVCYRFVRRTAKAQTATEAAAQVRAAARELHDNGLALRDGRILGVSYERAHQVVS